jgi:hypothetical protein
MKPNDKSIAGVLLALLLACGMAFAADSTEAAAGAASNSPTASLSDKTLNKDSAKAKATDDSNADAEPPMMKALKKGELSTSSTTGGVDPHGDSWQSIQNSFQQFAHPAFVLRLFLSLGLAVGCSWLIAWHPRGRQVDPIADMEERKAFIVLGVAGAIIAELSGASSTLALVIFGIGSLLRFRTVLDNPKATGKAILVVVIGLACGMGSWTMAVFVTAFSWVLLFWLERNLTCNLKIRLAPNMDPKSLQNTVHALLVLHRCRVQDCSLSKSKKWLEFLFTMPAKVDREQLEADLKAKVSESGEARVTLDLL